MPKYLIRGSYTSEGLKGVLKEGGSKRREAVEQLVSDIGGTVETFYFAFGDDDFIIIVDLPDNATMLAGTLISGASGTSLLKTTVLLTPDEVDKAIKKGAAFRPPGR
jgi:uncharacterized protein with GYD domain